MGLTGLNTQYKDSMTHVDKLHQQLLAFRTALDQALQQELSSRQGLPGFGIKAWLDLGAEMLLVPTLTFQVIKSLAFNTLKGLQSIGYGWWIFLAVLEGLWIAGFYLFNLLLVRLVSGVPDHEFGHINLKWLIIKLMHRNLIDLAMIGNVAWLFYFCGIPTQNFSFLINLAMVWLFFKVSL